MTFVRHDTALIMARGQSRRMGCPKGMCRLVAGGPTLLESIVDLYLDCGMTVVVLTLPELAAVYEACLSEQPQVRCLTHQGGDDTARTVMAAWRAGFPGLERPTHLWLHPVDLPLVRSSTLRQLAVVSMANPQYVLRPCVADQPGHPVIVPADLLGWAVARFATFSALAMRDVIDIWQHEKAGGHMDVPVDDKGCVEDIDDPDALARWGKDEML